MSPKSDLRLYQELAKSTPDILLTHNNDDSRQIDHMSMNPFEKSVYFLHRINCTTYLNWDGTLASEPGPLVRLASRETAASNAAEGGTFDQLNLDFAISVFVDLADHDGLKVLSRDPFVPSSMFEELMPKFADAGFGALEDRRFTWGSKIERFMWSAFVWRVNDSSEIQLVDAYVRKLADEVPDSIGAHLKKEKDQPIDLAMMRYINGNMSYGRWLSVEEVGTKFWWDIFNPLHDHVTKELVGRFKGRCQPPSRPVWPTPAR